jgi:hypothetical protein
MDEQINLAHIKPGTPVIGVDGVPIGTVEEVSQSGIRVAGQEVPPMAIDRIEQDGIHLRLARTAFEARKDPAV